MLGYWLLRNFSLGALDLAGTPQRKKGSRGQVVIRQFWLGIKSTEGVMGKKLKILPWAISLCASSAKQPHFPLRNNKSRAICHFSCPLEMAGMWRQTDRDTSEQEVQPCCLWAVWLGANCLTSLFRNLFTWFQWVNNIGDKDQVRQTLGWRAHKKYQLNIPLPLTTNTNALLKARGDHIHLFSMYFKAGSAPACEFWNRVGALPSWGFPSWRDRQPPWGGQCWQRYTGSPKKAREKLSRFSGGGGI